MASKRNRVSVAEHAPEARKRGPFDDVTLPTVTDEFRQWYDSLQPEDQGRVDRKLDSLHELGDHGLTFPVKKNLSGGYQELRTKNAIRIIYKVDRNKTPVVLVGGSKEGTSHGNKEELQWTADLLARADDLWQEYQREVMDPEQARVDRSNRDAVQKQDMTRSLSGSEGTPATQEGLVDGPPIDHEALSPETKRLIQSNRERSKKFERGFE